MSEFSDFLSSIIVTESFNYIQHVSHPTHIRGHTLDLVFTLGLNIDSICCEELHVTDHECALFNLSFNLDSLPSKHVKCSHILNHLSAEKFLQLLTQAQCCLLTITLLIWSTTLTHIAPPFWIKWLLVKQDLFPPSIHPPG